jgi:gliding motility-associated-like protein
VGNIIYLALHLNTVPFIFNYLMKKFAIFFILFCCFEQSRADHITGGEMSYKYLPATNQYQATLKLYMRCNSGRMFNNPTIISVFHKGNNNRVMDLDVPLSRTETISLSDPDPCISNPPIVCYEVGYYNFTLSLPPSNDGYIVAGQVNYRIAGIANLSQGYSQVGASYTMEIPGTSTSANDYKNNSAHFTGSDLVIVCANNPFTYSFAATDEDGDDLEYSFCQAYRSSSGPSGGGNSATAPLEPPYVSVPYGTNYSGTTPLGINVKIDSKTGLIQGIAPSAGVYVVTVCVQEMRNGKVIAVQRKDLQIAITSCSLTAAILQPEYLLCRDTKSIVLTNLSTSTLINAYNWEIKNSSGNTINTATTATLPYTFPDTGIYTIKLKINPGQRCSDSTTSMARVYPGFKPDFTFSGICFTKPTDFKDATTTVYGTVSAWHWNFGDAINADTSLLRNPVYTYTSLGGHNAVLLASNTNGCKDTVSKLVNVFDKPPVTLAFRDTLICPPDQLQLIATGRGNYVWTPAGPQIVNANTATPTVAPLTTTTYYVTLDDDGCINQDSLLVRVTNKVDLAAMNDTTICQGDVMQLRLTSNGLVYAWTPALQLDNPGASMPMATTISKTVYNVIASISTCTATDNITVSTVPYPIVNAGTDTLICFNSTAQLHGSTDGSKYSWTPASSLNNNTSLNPFAKPASTTPYVLSVSDTKGCPKVVTDTVMVIVLPAIDAEAGRDTAVIMGETILLNASGGSGYFWYPPTGLSAVNTATPTALYGEPSERIRYTVLVYNEAGCVDSAFITIKVFGTPPSIFVPTGFTPNGDGKNDMLRPIAVGMKQINRFNVYNRYGQEVFSTTINGHGWDGKVNGQVQQTGVYVWMVQAIDFNGKKYASKGTTTLIR